jgi:hypothetical protein
MHAHLSPAGHLPDWRADPEKRLRFSMLLSATVVAAVLSLVELPAPRDVLPMLELVVELSRLETREDTREEPKPEDLPVPIPAESTETVSEAPPAAETLPAPAPPATETPGDGEPEDWEALRLEAIRQVLDEAARERSYSVNPPFERARAEAAVRFRASLAPEERHIWDNVEKDQLGRTILRDGNCWRVLDDPSAVNRWAQDTFGQYTVWCDFVFDGKGRDLPWVDLIRERYPYLRDPVLVP